MVGGRKGGRGKDGTRVGGALKMGPANCAWPRTIGFYLGDGPKRAAIFSCDAGRDRILSGLGAAAGANTGDRPSRSTAWGVSPHPPLALRLEIAGVARNRISGRWRVAGFGHEKARDLKIAG